MLCEGCTDRGRPGTVARGASDVWLLQAAQAQAHSLRSVSAWAGRDHRTKCSGLPSSAAGRQNGAARACAGLLAEKYYEGCGGLDLSEEIKVTIAAWACVLLLHREVDYFSRLTTILVYPSAYIASATSSIGAGVIREEDQVRLGEAWKSGVVVVSWANIRATARGRNHGENLVLHEFAHQLDMEDGVADGTPRLARRSHYPRWTEVMGYEYERLRRDAELGRYSVLDKYGATNPAEFFAVATECFFEKPIVLSRRHPELYDAFKLYYHQDPARWDVPETKREAAETGDATEDPLLGSDA
jgi:Mlc titration factor MtfA (ptsG expression regulator)